MTDSPALLPRLAGAAIAGLKLLAVGLAALGLAIVATVTTATVSQIFDRRRKWNTTQ